MPDCVVDAAVLYYANGALVGRRPGTILDRRLTVIEQAARGTRRVRYNSKLLGEYRRVVQEFRNDVIEIFFSVLDSDRAVFVRRNNLSRQHYDVAVNRCRWPGHDQHLLAAALGGIDPTIFVSEDRHVQCRLVIYRHFRIRIEDLA